jgi:hypothetical protein
MRYLYLLCLFLFQVFPASAQYELDSGILKGKWQDKYDTSHVLVISGWRVVEYQNGIMTDSFTYQLSFHTCDRKYKSEYKEALFFKIYNSGKSQCFEITTHTQYTLSLLSTNTNQKSIFLSEMNP